MSNFGIEVEPLYKIGIEMQGFGDYDLGGHVLFVGERLASDLSVDMERVKGAIANLRVDADIHRSRSNAHFRSNNALEGRRTHAYACRAEQIANELGVRFFYQLRAQAL